MSQIRLVLAFHDHQPIGNFDGVFDDAHRDAYGPLLDTLADYPELKVVIHTSGSLMEWLVAHKPEYVDRLREFVQRGQVEILGGPFYEPILASIPSRDRVGQVVAYSRYLESLFGQKIRGMWLPERVWEQQFTRDLVNAGMEFSVLDDYHFRAGGMRGHELMNYYLTEDEGKLLALFPVDETLRYTIPFEKPERTIEYLRKFARENPGSLVTFGDDGEKFGVWPDTKEHVYGKGWMRKFLDLLMKNRDWLEVTHFGTAIDTTPPMGRYYVPDCSYREMTEWVLTTPRQTELKAMVKAHEGPDAPPAGGEWSGAGDWKVVKQYLRGGFWRNFRVKYPEANEMYCRMLTVSDRLDALTRAHATAGETSPVADPDLLIDARTHLYKGQCNCPYWHGAFGGLYLPHLRNAIYEHLIAADTALEKAVGKSGKYAEVDAADYDLDGRKEVRLNGDRLIAFLKPNRGGHLYELDLRGARHNLLATLDRRPEPYHEIVRDADKINAKKKEEALQKQAAAALHEKDTHAHHAGDSSHGSAEHSQDEMAATFQEILFKQPGLDQKLQYDVWPRKALVDHFLRPELTAEEFRRGEGELSDFPTGPYEATLKRETGRAEVVMTRTGHLSKYKIKAEKRVILSTLNGGALEVTYNLSDLPPGRPIHFAVELNFAGMPSGASDRYFYDAAGRQLGQLQTELDLPETDRLGLVDEWLGIDASVELTQPAGFWTWPIETISQSEGGYEAVHQSTVVVPHWEFAAPADGRWSVTLTLLLDTSAAQAKQLQEAAVG